MSHVESFFMQNVLISEAFLLPKKKYTFRRRHFDLVTRNIPLLVFHCYSQKQRMNDLVLYLHELNTFETYQYLQKIVREETDLDFITYISH